MKWGRGLGLAAIALVLAAPAFGGIKCWTNGEGVRECGNEVPPEYAQQETRTVNKQGLTVDVKQRAKSPEEIEREARQAAEAKRQQEEEKRRRDAELKYDQMLLSTFATEQDIVTARDRKLAAIDATIDITRSSMAKKSAELEEYKRRAAAMERSGKSVSPDLLNDIAMVQKQIDNKNGFIAAKLAEQQRLREAADADLARFRELKQQRNR